MRVFAGLSAREKPLAPKVPTRVSKMASNGPHGELKPKLTTTVTALVLGFNSALFSSFPLLSICEILRDSGVALSKVNPPELPLKNLKM